MAEEHGLPLVIVDGSPGIGCPVIASLTGADLVLVGHRTDRLGASRPRTGAASWLRQFRLPFAVCVNKADLNPELGARDRREAPSRRGALRRRASSYDPAVTRAQVAGTDVVDYGGGAAARELRRCGTR